jgi:hypothetical protein
MSSRKYTSGAVHGDSGPSAVNAAAVTTGSPGQPGGLSLWSLSEKPRFHVVLGAGRRFCRRRGPPATMSDSLPGATRSTTLIT